MATPASVTLPGGPVTPFGYHDYMWLYTDGEPVCQVVDGAPPGPEGRKYTVPVGKATKVPREVGRYFTEHLGYTGVVQVKETDRADGTGTDLDIESAKAESLVKFAEGDEIRWQQYMGYVMWKLEKKEIVPPPPPAIEALIKRRGYRLKDYGIDIMGQAGQLGGNAEMAALREQNAALAAQVAALSAKLDEALGETPAPPPKKGKV